MQQAIPLNIKSESGQLKTVILGSAFDQTIPTAEKTYDPKSLFHVKNGTYPTEESMVKEMDCFLEVLKKHQVTVYRPKNIPKLNQVFMRDVGFVIDDCFIKSNMIEDREKEIEGILYFVNRFERHLELPIEAHIEGGDVICWNEYIFIGVYKGSDFDSINCARTNMAGVEFIKSNFPNKKVYEFPLIKSNTNPAENCLHLDCCFQPVGADLAIIYEGGFSEDSYKVLFDIFKKENVMFITQTEMAEMNANIFSISQSVVVSEPSFAKVNKWLRSKGITVEEVEYLEIGKQGGLFRCSTMPLYRDE